MSNNCFIDYDNSLNILKPIYNTKTKFFTKDSDNNIPEKWKMNNKKYNLIDDETSLLTPTNNSKEKMDEIFNKSILKLMTDISNNSIFQKLKSKLYHKLKTDIKQYIEYEFKFTPSN
jgi:hypothetical protein